MALSYDVNKYIWSFVPQALEKENKPTTKTVYLIATPWSRSDGRGGGVNYSIAEAPPVAPASYRIKGGELVSPPAPQYQVLNLTSSTNLNQLNLPGTSPLGNTYANQLKGYITELSLNDQDNKAAIEANKKITAKNSFEQQAKTVIDNIKSTIKPGTPVDTNRYVTAKNQINSFKSTLINAGYTEQEAADQINNLIAPKVGLLSVAYSNDPSLTPSKYDKNEEETSALLNREIALNSADTKDKFSQFNKYRDGSAGYFFDKTDLGKQAAKEWEAYEKDDNLDIILRYRDKGTYGFYKYLEAVKLDPKNLNIRGSEAAPLQSKEYTETIRTDANNAQIRDNIFGLSEKPDPETGLYTLQNTGTGQEVADFIKTNKTATALFDQAKKEAGLAEIFSDSAQGQWSRLLKDVLAKTGVKTDLKTITSSETAFASFLGVVATLDSKTDGQIINNNKTLIDSIGALNSNTTFKQITSSPPEIAATFKKVITDSDLNQKKNFDVLRQQALKDTIAALKTAKQKESQIAYFQPLLKDLQSVQTEFNNSINNAILSDAGLSNVNPLGGQASSTQKKYKMDFGLDSIFNTKNGLIYNWQDWMNNEIEKKYAGDIDIPDDYIPPSLRTESNGFIDKTGWSKEKLATWDKIDKAYIALKTNPNNWSAKEIVKDLPEGYIPVEKRKTVQNSWTKYEEQLKNKGYVDPKVLSTWTEYDAAWNKWQKAPQGSAEKTTAEAAYNALVKPKDYITPDLRMGQEAQFAKDFYSQYLKPRFDSSQSIAEFQDYIDVTDKTQNPFQTQDKVNALTLAAQSSISNWYANLQKLGTTKQNFNAEYYINPNSYLQTFGLSGKDAKGGDVVLLENKAFADFAQTVSGVNADGQAKRVDADWNAAKAGKITKDDYGNNINWAAKAYEYGINLDDQNAFAELHYQLVGMRALKRDKDGNVVYEKDENGKDRIDSQGNKIPVKQGYDGSPAMLAPGIASLYISKVLTPLLIKEGDKIGTVFGQFIKPEEYVDNLIKAVGLVKDTPQWKQLLTQYKLDPNSSLTELKNELASALAQDSTVDIKAKIGNLIDTAAEINQKELGVEYIQRDTTPSGTTTAPSGVYAIFKNAGFNGTEKQFYDQFMPGASSEDIQLINSAYTPGGIKGLTGIDTSASPSEQFESIGALFGDTDFAEISSLTGTQTTAKPKASLFSFDDTASEDSFSFKDPLAMDSGKSEMGIGDPFDEIGIGDPFAETNDPFSDNANPFESIKASTSSKIGSIGNFFSGLSSKSKSNSFADFSSWSSF